MIPKLLAVVAVFAAVVALWGGSADAQNFQFVPAITEIFYNMTQFNAVLAQTRIAGVNFNPRTVIINCQIRLNEDGGCNLNSAYLQLKDCRYNGTNFSASFPANATLFSLQPTVLCGLKNNPNLEISYCNTVGCTSAVSTDRISNTNTFAATNIAVSDPTANAIVPLPTRLISSTTQDIFSVTGNILPRACCDGDGTVATRSWQTGAPCAASQGVSVSGQSSTGNLARVTANFATSALLDGCYLMLSGLRRDSVPIIGPGVTYPTNIARSYIAVSPAANFGLPSSLFRTSTSLTLTGVGLPKSNEAYQILLSATGGNCTGTTECVITSYNDLNNITCRADLSVFRGDDSLNGGCLISSRITRLGYAGVATNTNMRCPNILPPVAPIIGSGQPFNLTASSTQRGLAVADLNAALAGAQFAVSVPSSFNLTSGSPCTLFLNLTECAITSMSVAVQSCLYANSTLSGIVAANAVASFANSAVCQIVEIGLRARFCNDSSCITTVLLNFTNTAFSSKLLINAAPSVNALTKGSTRIGGSSTLLVISGSALPLLGDPVSIDFSLVPIDGGVCDTPVANATIVSSSTGTTTTIEYVVSPYNDGCRIQLASLSRAFVPATGAGVTTQNVVRDYIAGNPIISFGAADEGNRTSRVTFTLYGTNFPLGAAEEGFVSLTTTGGTCFTIPSTGIRCNITSYETDSLNCTADLTFLVGDDELNGGCPIFASVVRLGTVGPLDATGLSYRYYGAPLAPPMDPPVMPPVAAPQGPAPISSDPAPTTTPTAPQPTSGGNSVSAPTSSVQGSSDSGSAAVIGGAVGGSIGALLIIGLIVLLVLKSKGGRVKSLEDDSPFQEPSYIVK